MKPGHPNRGVCCSRTTGGHAKIDGRNRKEKLRSGDFDKRTLSRRLTSELDKAILSAKVIVFMEDVTRMLGTIENGEATPEALLPVVYQELRRMAAGKMAKEEAGHTLQATALVHEAWMRLSNSNEQGWENRAHFFGAAAEAMRRILVDHARKKNSVKRGGRSRPEELHDESAIALTGPAEELLAVNDALDSLALEDPKAAELVKLRYFVGMTMDEAAEAMAMKKRSAEALWTYARVWLKRAIKAANG